MVSLYSTCVCLPCMEGRKEGVIYCQEVDARKVFSYNTRLLARQFLLITPLISWVDKVHTSTIDE
ncbi:MAG TPA: hypothetical protein DDW33_04075 [Ktedonobacter sp.]|jgi:hypothetical protein|nr:hypothetical protein [Ktedonobacter sp.]HBE24848.1 hypothetical protein [Ktedonobacter sp.]HBE27982.1 hypothetical protein [Ktedonobacter sp.]HCJ35785.1 hypothetical protein [Ktedonobacter sp.]